MLIDNNNNNPSIQEWIKHNTSEGIFNTVTGYFTIGALAFLSREINDKVDKFNFILGDFVHDDLGKEHGVDLLNENLSADGAFQLSTLAQKAVDFLNQDKVVVKTFEPNFCHAKAYMFQDNNNTETIQKLSSAIRYWLNKQAYEEEEDDDGSKKRKCKRN